MAGGVVHIPWYATLFRGDKLEAVLKDAAALVMRYGATEYELRRYRDDRYKFIQSAVFEDKLDFERYWYGAEMSDFRARYGTWFQTPLYYEWWDRVVYGSRERAREEGLQEEGQEPAAPASEVLAPVVETTAE